MAPAGVPKELLELLAKLSKTKLAYVASVVTGLLGDMGISVNRLTPELTADEIH